jgi:hypothetical protein
MRKAILSLTLQPIKKIEKNQENSYSKSITISKYRYDIKVNNNSQRVLPVNSYRYDILLPHNPQLA